MTQIYIYRPNMSSVNGIFLRLLRKKIPNIGYRYYNNLQTESISAIIVRYLKFVH